MSKNLISATAVANYLGVICLALFAVFFVLFIISLIVWHYYSKKIAKIDEERSLEEEDFISGKEEANEKLQSEEYTREEYNEEVDQLYKNREKYNEDYYAKVKAVSGKRSDVSDIFSEVFAIIIVVAILFGMWSAIGYSNASGDVSNIIEVKDVSSQNVSVTAYYDIEYHSLDQETLVVFVKNNSDKVLKSAVIKEKNSGISENIGLLSPGQEKIVSLDLNEKNKNNEYQFELEDIEFME